MKDKQKIERTIETLEKCISLIKGIAHKKTNSGINVYSSTELYIYDEDSDYNNLHFLPSDIMDRIKEQIRKNYLPTIDILLDEKEKLEEKLKPLKPTRESIIQEIHKLKTIRKNMLNDVYKDYENLLHPLVGCKTVEEARESAVNYLDAEIQKLEQELGEI